MEYSESPQEALRRTFRMALDQQVASGKRIESQSELSAVLVSGKPVNHILHLLLSFFTAGLWLIVWFIVAMSGGETREALTVTQDGQVIIRNLNKKSSTGRDKSYYQKM